MKLKIDISDATLICGIGVIAYGLYLIYQPLAPIFTGSSLIYLALIGSKNG